MRRFNAAVARRAATLDTGLWLAATRAGFPPACQQTISSPHVHRIFRRLADRSESDTFRDAGDEATGWEAARSVARTYSRIRGEWAHSTFQRSNVMSDDSVWFPANDRVHGGGTVDVPFQIRTEARLPYSD
jgi:hypothetical protein